MHLAVVSVAFASLVLAGCAPASPYRHTALAPSAQLPSFDGRTAPEGTLRVEGSVYAKGIVQDLLPQLGSTALWTPAFEANGTLALAVSDSVELGVRGAFAHGSWLTTSAVGTPPLGSERAYVGVGPELRATFFNRGGRGFALGLVLGAVASRVPTASWQRLSAPCSDPATCYTDPTSLGLGNYRLTKTGNEDVLTTSAFLYPTYAFGEGYGHVIGAFGVTSNFKNDGFSNSPNGSPIEPAALVPVAGFGYGVSWHGARLSALGYVPLKASGEGVNYGPGAVVTVGGDLSLWKNEPPPPAPGYAPVPVNEIERRADEAQGEVPLR
jgi:hypothetical protein